MADSAIQPSNHPIVHTCNPRCDITTTTATVAATATTTTSQDMMFDARLSSTRWNTSLMLMLLASACAMQACAWNTGAGNLKMVDRATTTPHQQLPRRSFVGAALSVAIAGITGWQAPPTLRANAADASKPEEFKNVGTQAPAPDGQAPFVTLPSGVKIKDIKEGTGDAMIQPDSARVNIQCSGRLLNLNGIIFYNTKNNNPDGFGALPLIIDLGKGQAVPGLEQGLVGMKKGGIRRIIVPQELGYTTKSQELEPRPMNANDQRALDSVVKNSRRDGALLFDVQLERFRGA